MSTRSRWSLLYAGGTACAIFALMVASHSGESQAQVRTAIQNVQTLQPSKPKDWIVQYASKQAGTQSVETNLLLRVATARTQFAVDGTGLTVAVMDTGLRMSHVDFATPGKIPTFRNFTTDDGGNPQIVTDVDGHGTNVAGIAVANGIHTGVAPGARVIPLKVLDNTGSGQFQWMVNALDWVISNRNLYNIRVVNMSIGAGQNFQSEAQLPGGGVVSAIRQRIQTLRNLGVPVCIAAGNSFWEWASQEGMDFPGIIRESISVGAVFDADVGEWPFFGSPPLSTLPGFPNALPLPAAFSSGPRRLTPFSQRLSAAVNPQTKTDVFAPGSVLTSTGNLNDTAESSSSGTSQATPVVSGICLLLQQYYFKRTGTYPTVAQLEKWLSTTSPITGNLVFDGDDEDDNVVNTNRQYPMVDAIEALNAAKKDLAPPSPPPSAVTTTYNSATKTLTLSGDANGSNLTISAQGNKVTLSGSSTTINGKSSVSYTISPPFTLAGNMNAGDDNLSLISLNLSNLTLNLGVGADRVVMNYCTVTNSALNGGADTDVDTVITTTSSITTNNNVNFP